jgi:hypothetical protein
VVSSFFPILSLLCADRFNNYDSDDWEDKGIQMRILYLLLYYILFSSVATSKQQAENDMMQQKAFRMSNF